MFVKQLRLKNFRNYEQLDMEFGPRVNILTGDNAQGKTNILEALYFCAYGRSHRTSKDSEMFGFGSSFTGIQADVRRERTDKKINIAFQGGKKYIEINGRKIVRIQDLLGNLNVVMFSPEDLKVVKETPGIRRRFLDMEICALDRIYYHDLVDYNRILSERNNLLKMKNADLTVLDVYDDQLSQAGGKVSSRRMEYLRALSREASGIHKSITSDRENIEFIYRPSWKNEGNIREGILTSLRDTRRNDIMRQTTSSGPHRDDFSILINGTDARHFGSQGQQRTAILTLKFASLGIIRKTTGEYPLLLLDDVLSELDVSRQNYILSSIEGIQTIITMTGYENIESRLLEDAKIFRVIKGSAGEV